jgi:hypothetical protein
MTIKLHRPKDWRQNLPFFVTIAIVTSNHSYKSVCLVGHLSMRDNFKRPWLLSPMEKFHVLSYQFLHVTSFRFWTFGEHLLTQSILRQYLCDKVSEISPLFSEIWYLSYLLLLSMSGEKQKFYFEFQILHQTIW